MKTLFSLTPLALSLALVSVAHPPAHAEPPSHMDRRGEMADDVMRPHLLKKLNLTDEQKKKFREYRLSQEKKKIQLRSDKALAELELLKAMQTYPVNASELMKRGEKISLVQEQMAKERLRGLGFFLENLTAEQHAKFVEMQESMRERRKERMEKFRDKMDKDRDQERDRDEQPGE